MLSFLPIGRIPTSWAFLNALLLRAVLWLIISCYGNFKTNYGKSSELQWYFNDEAYFVDFESSNMFMWYIANHDCLPSMETTMTVLTWWRCHFTSPINLFLVRVWQRVESGYYIAKMQRNLVSPMTLENQMLSKLEPLTLIQVNHMLRELNFQFLVTLLTMPLHITCNS